VRSLALLGLCVLPARLDAQDSVRLRFTPAFGTALHRVFQVHTRIEVLSPRGAATPREVVDLGGVEQITLAGPAGETVVHLAFDSLRTVARRGDEPWREVAWGALDSVWAQVWTDPWLRVGRITVGANSPATALLLQFLAGGVAVPLPDPWLRAGDAWTVEHRVSLLSAVSRAPGSVDTLSARTRFALDSAVARATDTLAYLRFEGELAPGGAAGAGAVTYAGGLAGSMVWSTGWSTFVSGTVRLRVQARLPTGEEAGGPADATVTLETTTRQQVRGGT
jgi:hypothetical protein